MKRWGVVLTGRCSHRQARANDGPARRLRELLRRHRRRASEQHGETEPHVREPRSIDVLGLFTDVPRHVRPRVRERGKPLGRPAKQAEALSDAHRRRQHVRVHVFNREGGIGENTTAREADARDGDGESGRRLGVGPGIEILRDSGRRDEQQPDARQLRGRGSVSSVSASSSIRPGH